MLSPEIPPPDRKKFLTIKVAEDWKNPFLMLNSDGTLALIAVSTGRRELNSAELESALIALPVDDWSFGRVIAVQPCALRSGDKEQFAREDRALKETWSRMRDTMSKLQVQTNLWPSA